MYARSVNVGMWVTIVVQCDQVALSIAGSISALVQQFAQLPRALANCGWAATECKDGPC